MVPMRPNQTLSRKALVTVAGGCYGWAVGEGPNQTLSRKALVTEMPGYNG